MRLLIVDDERYIVNYLASLIEENISSDLEVYKCYSGVEALDLLKSIKMDIMLQDIHMPGMSGLEVAAQVNELLPNCRIIFLTAYDNFEHIYESNRLKNTRYLLKMESDEVILKEINAVIDELEKEADKLHLLSEAQQKTLLLSHLLQQNLLKGILAGQEIDSLKSELTLAGADFELDLQSPVYLMYTQINYKTLVERNTENSTYTLQYLQIIRNLLLEKFKFSMLDMGKGTLLWFFQPVTVFPSEFEFLKTVANDFGDYCGSTLHRQITEVLYPKSSSWDQVCNHFHTMQQYTESSVTKVPLIYSSVNVLDNDTTRAALLNTEYSSDRSAIEHQFQELSFYLYQGSEKEYLNVLRQLKAECIKIRSMHDISAIKIYGSVALMLLNYIDLYHLQEKIVTKVALYPLYYTHDFASWQDAFHYLETVSIQIFDILSSNKSNKNEWLVNKIKTYIEEHLSESLTLTTISRLVNYNETYISRLFKQLTGMGLSEYISNARIQKAKYLLSTTNKSMQSIASEIGFDTAQYFSIVFKKTVGISPSEYRRTSISN